MVGGIVAWTARVHAPQVLQNGLRPPGRRQLRRVAQVHPGLQKIQHRSRARRQAVRLARVDRMDGFQIAGVEVFQHHLQVVLEDFNTGDLEPIHAVYPGKPDRLPPRTRAVLDFLQARVDLRHAAQLPPPWRA